MTGNHTYEKKDLYPLTSSQSRIWFLENLDREITAYNIPLDYRIRGELDTGLLRQSIQRLIDRHAAFRTVFPKLNSHPLQQVLPSFPLELTIVHLENEPAENIKDLISFHSKENANHKFDLENGPLYCFRLLILGNHEYIFLVNFHHIISDAASVNIFMDELGTIYHALAAKEPVNLPPLALTYPDYAVLQNKWLESEDCKGQLAYWKEELAGASEVLQLPLDFARPKIQTYNGSEYHFPIPPEIKEKMSAIGKRHGTSLFISMLSAFEVLLSKYSLQDDLVIGIPVANRNQENLESLIGVFINSLPLRFSISSEKSFSEAVDLTKKKFLSAFENREVPFERLVDELKKKRTMNISPVFQVLFNFLKDYQEDMVFPDFTIQPLEGVRTTSQVDLTLTVIDRKHDLKGIIEYNTDLFKRETIHRLAGHYLNLLKAVAGSESIRLHEIPLSGPDELKLMLDGWNQTKTEYQSGKCIHHLFEEQVEKTPDATAVVFENESLTYNELNQRANRLAHHLAGKGVHEDIIVAVFLNRSMDIPWAFLAVSKTGGTYLPLDPIYPAARIKLILDDAKPLVILSQSSLLGKLPETGAEIILMDDPSLAGNEPFVNLPYGNPQKPAYLLYTSGSTGKPKGVLVKQHSTVNVVNSLTRLLRVTNRDVLLSTTTITFDVAEMEMYLPLFNGAKLVIGTQESAVNIELLKANLKKYDATLFLATPVTFRMLVMSGWEGKPDLRILSGGEGFPKELARKLLSLCKEVWNGYAPTETTIYSLLRKVTPEDTVGDGYVTLGRPLDNTILYVLNPKQVPVPAGVPGELYIGGDGVSAGYFNLPDLNRERFVTDPLGLHPETLFYKTGDLVKYTPEGNVIFMNRIDFQVKIRGFRIELGEIESVLSQYPSIKECVVIVREDASGEKTLAAYYIQKEKAETDIHSLRQYLKERLPEYMIPNAFVRMERFPLTSTQKIDRKALPEPQVLDNMHSSTYVEPVTSTQQKLARIWSSLLKIRKIGIRDDFFDIGGHSMIAVTLMLQIEKEFGIRLPLATLFERSTIESLSGLIDSGSESLSWRSLVPIRPQGSKKPLFLVHGLGLNVLLYTTIVNYLDPDQPVYGLQAKGLNGKDEPLNTIEEIAAHYISEIRTIEPEGPYAMAGFSLGGKIAYEMARQLSAMGKQVRFLGLIDATAEGSVRNLPFFVRNAYRVKRTARYVGWNISSFFRNDHESKLSLIRRRWQGIKRRLNGLDVRLSKEDIVSEGKMSELPKYLRKVHRANRRANNRYAVSSYNGPVHLFKAKKQTFYIEDPISYGWEKAALGGVFIHEIPGEHSRIFAPPNDKYFAETLQINLDHHFN